MEWIDGNKNSVDTGTKNLDTATHKKHTKVLCDDNDKFEYTKFHAILKWGRVLQTKD